MGFIKNLWQGIGRFISKNIFGLNTNTNNQTISILNKELDRLRRENIILRQKLKSQEILLEECERNFNIINSTLNKLIEFKIYASIVGSKAGSSVVFEFRHRGIVLQKYEDEEILEYYSKNNHISELLSKFKIDWIDVTNIDRIYDSGIDSSLIQELTTSDLQVEFSVDSGSGFASRLVPNVKVINEFDM